MVLGDLASLSPAIVIVGDVFETWSAVVAVVRAMTKSGRVGVVFATEEKSLKRPHEVTATLQEEVEGCTTTIGEN